MILRIVVYHIKKRWYIMNIPITGFVVAFSVSAIAPKMGVWFSVFLAMLATIVLYVPLVSELSRSEIDFVFSTPADPRFIFIWTFLAEWFLYSLGFSLGFILYTYALHHMPIALDTALLQRLADPFLYIASIAVPAATLGVFIRMLSFLRFEKLALAWLVVPIAGAALLTCQLAHPSPYWMTVTSLIISLVYLSLQEYYTRELYTNAYGLLEELLPRPRPAVADGPMPRSLWELVWRTSGGIIEALIMAAYISAVGVVAYLLPFFLPLPPDVDSQGLALVFATMVMPLFLLLWHLSDLRLERLWISFSADHYAYVRYRMAARSLASLVATSPWIVAYMAIWLRLDHLPAAYAAASLVSASLAFPILAWLIGALWSQPQIREYGLSQRLARYTAESLLSLLPLLTIGLYLAPAFLAAAGYSASAVWLSAFIAAFSAAFFYIALFTRLGRGLWDWLVDRLAAAGYV